MTAKAAADVKTFTNTNKSVIAYFLSSRWVLFRFVVPKEYREPFDAVWENRKKVMESSKGFEGLKIDDGSYRKDGNREITVSSMWKSIPDWEAYSCSLPARRSHLPPVNNAMRTKLTRLEYREFFSTFRRKGKVFQKILHLSSISPNALLRDIDILFRFRNSNEKSFRLLQGQGRKACLSDALLKHRVWI